MSVRQDMGNDNGTQSILIAKDDVLSLLFRLFPWAEHFRSEPLRNYAAELFSVAPSTLRGEIRSHAMILFQRAIERAARSQGLSEEQVNRLQAEIPSAPVMQTGPHLHLLVEPDAFYTHIFSMMGLNAHHRNCYISYGCSTVKFVERGRKGPAWLNINDLAINVFGLSRRQMIPYSILARNSSYRFDLRCVDQHRPDTDTLIEFRKALPTQEFPSAADAIKAANQKLWPRYFDEDITFLQVDDDDISALVIDHLADQSSWLASVLIGNLDFARSILEHVDRLDEGPWRGWLRNSTHYFWGSDSGRLFPLTLEGRVLRARGSEQFSLLFTAEDLLEALARRRVVPNLLLMFIVTSILPGIRVLGGSRHAVYFPLMRHVFCGALADTGKHTRLLAEITADVRPSAWGHRVIREDADPFAELHANGDVGPILDRYSNMMFDTACGSLPGFTHDSQWVSLSNAFASRAGSPMLPRWSFSRS